MNKRALILIVLTILAIGLILPGAISKPGIKIKLTGPKECKDGVDNDGDGLIDLDDPGCTDKNDRSEWNLPPWDPPGDPIEFCIPDNRTYPFSTCQDIFR